MRKKLTRQINSDCEKLRRFALHLFASGYLQRWPPKKGHGGRIYTIDKTDGKQSSRHSVCCLSPTIANNGFIVYTGRFLHFIQPDRRRKCIGMKKTWLKISRSSSAI